MQISLNYPNETTAKLTVVTAPPELERLKSLVLNRFQDRVKVAGFREGKAPLALIEKNVDPALLQSEFLEEAVNQMYVRAIEEKRLRPVSNPQVNLTKFVPFTTLEFVAEVEVVGEIKLPDYKKIRKPKPAVSVTAKDVNEVLESLRQRIADKKDVERAAKPGDVVWIDFEGKDERGQEVQGAAGKDYPLTLGSNSFIPGFEDNLVGLKAGEDKTYTLKFPPDYGVSALAGKAVTFSVHVTKVQAVMLPKLDDEFAGKVGPFKTLSDLKADIKKQLTAERQAEADRQYENELILEIAKKAKVALPKSMVDDQIHRLEQDEKQNLAYRGQTWREHLEAEGVNEEQHSEQKRPAAEERVKASLVLAEIADQENLAVSPEELEIRLQLLKGQYQDKSMQAELDTPQARRDIASRILTEKTVETLVSYAAGKQW